MSLEGVLVIDKPRGLTSFDVIRRLRRLLRTKKMGHCGTLDPAATGVLIVCIGWATKAVPYLTADDKEYLATVALGVETDSYDADGEIVAESEIPARSDAEIEHTLDAFRGIIRQRPPAHSAVHVDGKRAYELARRGENPEIPLREVVVHELELLNRTRDALALRCVVSKGTYIRSIAHDLGQALGCGAHLASLRRTRAGAMTLDSALSLDELAEADDAIALAESRMLAIPDALTSLQRVTLDDENSWRFTNGLARILDASPPGALHNGDVVVLRESDGRFLGLGRVAQSDEQTLLKPRRVYETLDAP